MKIKVLLAGVIFFLLSFSAKAQLGTLTTGKNDTIKVGLTSVEGQLMPWVPLNTVFIRQKRVFKTPQDLANYRRLRYNVLKVLPYAKFAGNRYRQLERDLAIETNKKKQKQLVKACEKEIKDLFNREIKNLTISQGEILIKLIDRETQRSSFDLVKETKGGISAFVFQSVAKVFGHDLKTKYDPSEDREIENIIMSAGYYSFQ